MATETAAAAKRKTIKQVEHGTGSLGHFNLDGQSFDRLHKIERYHSSLGTPVSLSVIVRRSIRAYYDYLNHLENEADKTNEALLLFKAAKGT